MKNKSHISSWAIALCAVAVFSFSASVTAHGARLPLAGPGPSILPISEIKSRPSQPPPPIAPPVESGTYNGTVSVD